MTRLADMVLVVVGVRPDTTLAASAGAALGVRGAIAVDRGMRTNLPDVYAAGDCVVTHHRLLGETYLPLGTTAHKQGRVAGENALGGTREFAGSLGTQVVKIFDQAAARTGLRDHEAAAAGYDPVTVQSEADDHKAYYPGSHRITMRFTGDRATGRLLGVQLFGHRHAEIAKRVDIAATAIFHSMTVDGLSDLDLSYTPPLGSPWDAIQMGAQAWLREASQLLTTLTFSRGNHASQRRTASPHHSSHAHRHPQCGCRDHRARPGRLHARTTTAPPHQHQATTAAAASGPGMTLTGAGSTFDAPFFDLAFARYHQQHPAVTVNYSAVGSSAGITAFSAKQADFGASDVPMTASRARQPPKEARSPRCPTTWVPKAWPTT